MWNHFIGIDLGGTGAKVGLFDARGDLVRVASRKYSPHSPAPGQAEIPIATIYNAAREACREVCTGGIEVTAAAISSQGQTFVTLDADDRPLHDAIMWYDSRGADHAQCLNARLAARTPAGKKSPSVDAIASVAKILWLRDHVPAMTAAARYLLLPDYLSYRLTGIAAVDTNTATSSGLYNPGASGYDDLILAATGIRLEQLSALVQPGRIIGPIRPDMAVDWGLQPSTVLVAGTNDQYAGALGAGNCRERIVTETSGTCLALVTLARTLPDPMPVGILGGPFPIEGLQFVLTFAKTAGVVIDWFHREFAPDLRLDELDLMAASSPPGANGLTVLPHFDGTISPVPNQSARGVISGLTLHHTRADIYRGILESLAFSLRENLEHMERHGFRFDTIRSIGGGAKSDVWLKIKADATGKPIEKPAVTEAAIKGAAMLAAFGTGAFTSLAECSATFYKAARVVTPDPSVQSTYDAAYRAYKTLKVHCYNE